MTRQQADTGQGSFAAELFEVLREEPYRDPLYDSVRKGQIERAGMKLWATQAMLVVGQFTRFISAIHSNCPHADAQKLLAENLWEEHGRGIEGRDHLSLIKKLAKSLGATDEEIHRTEALPETASFIDHCARVTREGSFVEGMAAIGLGIEHFSPRFFAALADMLREQYGLASEDVEYLLVHVGEDEDHARRSLEMIERYADTPEAKQKAKQALRDLLRVKRRFAEALYAHCSQAS